MKTTIVLLLLVSCTHINQIKQTNDIVFLYKKDMVIAYNRLDTTYLESDSVMIYKYSLSNANNTFGNKIKLPIAIGSSCEYKEKDNESVKVTLNNIKIFRVKGDEYEIGLYTYMSSFSDGSYYFYFCKKYGTIRHNGLSNNYSFQLVKKDGDNEQVLFVLNELIRKHMKPNFLSG